MSKEVKSKIPIEVMLILYIGVILIVGNSLFSRFFPFYLGDLIFVLGELLIIYSFLLLFYRKLCKKIDLANYQVSSLNEVGIERIFRYKHDRLEQLISTSRQIRIAINVKRLDSVWFVLDSITVDKNIHIDILILGSCSELEKQKIDILGRKDNITIKFVEESGVDNIIILEQRTCILNYSDYDNSLEYVSVFLDSSDFGQKNRKLFEGLWNDTRADFYDNKQDK